MHFWARCIMICMSWCLLSYWTTAQVGVVCDLSEANAIFNSEEYVASIDAYESILKEEVEKSCLIKIYYRLGRAYTYLSSYRTANLNFEWALKLLEEEPDLNLQAKCLSGIAYAQSKLGNFQEAYAYEMEALKIAETENHESNIYRSVYQLGNYAQNIDNYSKALEYYLRVESMMKEDTSIRYATLLGGIGSVYMDLGELDHAIDFLERSADWGMERQNLTILSYALGNLGEAHAKAGNLELAMDYIGLAIEKKEELGDLTGVVDSKLKQGELWLTQQRYGRAEAAFMEAMQQSLEIGAKIKLLDCYEALKGLFAENGQFEKAFFYLDKYTLLKNEVLNENILELIEEQNAIYQTAEKDAEIRKLKEIQLQRDENDRLKAFITISFLLMAITLIIIGFRVNRKLSHQNESLAAFGKQLEQKNIELEHFAHIASHDLKAPLRTINSFTTLLGKKYVKDLDDKAQEYMSFIHKSVIDMQTLLDDLLNYARADHAGAEPVNTESKDLLDTAIRNLSTQIDKKKAKIVVRPESLPSLEVVPSQMVQLFQNLIANALKFTNGKNPVVQVNCIQESRDFYRFSVQDNGIGIAEEDQQKIFEMFSRLHHEEVYKGSGIGLATCQKIVGQYGGRIWVESTPGEGATFYFTMPNPANEKSRTV